MDLLKQDSVQIKECVVQLERLATNMEEDSSDDSTDLPFLYATARKRTGSRKPSKSSSDLLKEHESLAKEVEIETFTNIQETIRKLEIVQIEQPVDDRSSVSSDPPPSEEKDVKIFCVTKDLQFFTPRDVTLAQCGYNSRHHDSPPLSEFETKMLSYAPVQFEHVITSFLYSAKWHCISDLKSFVSFLLKTMSVRTNISCISACYRVLVSLLENHIDSSSLSFNSVEIFILLFNYGIDIDHFMFLSKWTDLRRKLVNHKSPNANSCEIPDRWHFNMKFMLKALVKIFSSCTFKSKDMQRIIIFLMCMSTDPLLLKENLRPAVQESIYVCLENIKEEKWNKIQCYIINEIISLESSTVIEKWSTVYNMIEALPNRCIRAIQLRKQLSFTSLKCLVTNSEDLEDLEDCLEFSVNDLQFVIRQLAKISSELLNFAIKFLDNCVKHLNASEEEYDMLSRKLKECETTFIDKAKQNEKTQFLKIYAKLRIFCGQKEYAKNVIFLYKVLECFCFFHLF